MEDTSLNWENLLTNTGVRYNTIYHSTIASTPFELLFDKKARLPSFPNEDIKQIHHSETSAAEHF
jgi:hypothetical protein